MRLIDRISIAKVISMLLNFILNLVDKLKKEDNTPPKRKRKLRKSNE